MSVLYMIADVFVILCFKEKSYIFISGILVIKEHWVIRIWRIQQLFLLD